MDNHKIEIERMKGELETLGANAVKRIGEMQKQLEALPSLEDWDMLIDSDCAKANHVDELIAFIQSQGQELWDKWCARKGGNGCFNCTKRTKLGRDGFLRCEENDKFTFDCITNDIKYWKQKEQKHAALRKLTEKDCEGIYNYALKRSKEILEGTE